MCVHVRLPNTHIEALYPIIVKVWWRVRVCVRVYVCVSSDGVYFNFYLHVDSIFFDLMKV